jgi:hypothetical protein
MRQHLSRSIRLILALSLLGIGLLHVPLAAQAQQPQRAKFVGLRAGFDGHLKEGQWAPVEITIRGGSQSLTGYVEIVTNDGDGVPSRVRSRPVQVLPGRDESVLLYVKFAGASQDEMLVSYVVEGRVAVERTFRTFDDAGDKLMLPVPLNSQQKLIVAVGPSIGLEEVAFEKQNSQDEQLTVARLENTRQLPTRWYGYEGVDLLVLTTSRPEIYKEFSPAGAQHEALDTWIRMGGRLLLCVGANAPQVIGRETPLAAFAPGEFSELETLRSTKALERFSESSKPIRPDNELRMSAPRLDKLRGKVVESEGSLPLIVRTPHGLGEIVFIAADLDRAPLVDWSGRKQFVHKLLTGKAVMPAPKDDAQASNYLGISDLTAQLRNALDQFEGVRLVPFSVVAGLVFLYILLIGPGDFFLVKRLLRRMELTWITFPVMVLAVSLGAYLLAYHLKGDQLRINQVNLVDVDIQSGLVRGTTWLNVFSPRTADYNLTLHPRLDKDAAGDVISDNEATNQAATSEVLLSWLGMPGSVYGGMGRNNAGPQLFSGSYDYSPNLDALIGVPIQVWSTKSFSGRWRYQAESRVEADLSMDKSGVAEGSLTSKLEFPLSNALLLCGEWAYEIGDLKPGEIHHFRPGEQRSLTDLLKDYHIKQGAERNSYVQASRPWDHSTFDVPTIVRQMMFDEAAGGHRYTGLLNRYQAFADLSDHLQMDQAILVGMVEGRDRPGATAADLFDGQQSMNGPQDKHWTFYRFVFPVAKTAAEGKSR